MFSHAALRELREDVLHNLSKNVKLNHSRRSMNPCLYSTAFTSNMCPLRSGEGGGSDFDFGEPKDLCLKISCFEALVIDLH